MKKKRLPTEKEMVKLKAEADQIYNLYLQMGTYPYEMYTLLASYALKENIPFDMDIYLKVTKT